MNTMISSAVLVFCTDYEIDQSTTWKCFLHLVHGVTPLTHSRCLLTRREGMQKVKGTDVKTKKWVLSWKTTTWNADWGPAELMKALIRAQGNSPCFSLSSFSSFSSCHYSSLFRCCCIRWLRQIRWIRWNRWESDAPGESNASQASFCHSSHVCQDSGQYELLFIVFTILCSQYYICK